MYVELDIDQDATKDDILDALREGGAVYADAQGVLRVTSRKA